MSLWAVVFSLPAAGRDLNFVYESCVKYCTVFCLYFDVICRLSVDFISFIFDLHVGIALVPL